MPMLKTADSGTTRITNVKRYLEKGQRQERGHFSEELRLYEQGEALLSSGQAGALKKYLGESTRALAVDVSEDLSRKDWARQMDLTRSRFRHDKATGGRRPRTYYHFILSPDMNDACDLSTMQAYARAWAEANFRKRDRLCEYAIVYHDDNAKGVLHAHIIVNVTNKATGRKLHFPNNDVVALEISAQDVGRRFGLTPIRKEMQLTTGARTTQPIYLTREEREVLSKGGYSWKWELRKIVSDLAPLCSDLEDLKLKLNRAGYDVERSDKTGYLTYTHKNGKKVKDCRLGSRFYIESLGRLFSHECVLSDQTYTSWELIKISKGEVPWKEEIRRAIDAVAPTVMSVPELQHILDERYGIRLIVNRRGITYQHSCGFKVRDVGIGLRYTFEGLRQNAVVDTLLPYPHFHEIEQSSQIVARHYMPRSHRGIDRDIPALASVHTVFHDISGLMVRNGLTCIDDIPKVLEERQELLKDVKTDLCEMRGEVRRWNHLTVLQSRYERDRDFLESSSGRDDAGLYNEMLLRCGRLAVYLKEQTGGIDPKIKQKEISGAYEKRLESYQEQLSQLERDVAIYRNYLIAQNVRLADSLDGHDAVGISAERLVAASKTLSMHRIRNFYHLEQVLSDFDTKLDLARFRWEKADNRAKELESVWGDIRSFEEAKTVLPKADVLRKSPETFGVEIQKNQLKEASVRLQEAGIKETDFAAWKKNYRDAVRAAASLRKAYEDQQSIVAELKAARDACRLVAETFASSAGLEHEQPKSAASSGGVGIAQNDSPAVIDVAKERSKDAEINTAPGKLPLEEAKARRKGHPSQSPGRSRRFEAGVIR